MRAPVWLLDLGLKVRRPDCRGMLSSEVPWFWRFIQICRLASHFMNKLDRDGLQDMDYDVMKQVIQCEEMREVWTIVNAYNDPVFRRCIQTYEELAQYIS